MQIETEVMKRLNSFENSELQRLLQTVEDYEYYASGYKNLNGGFASATAYELEEAGYYDEEKDEEFDIIKIELESGLQDMGDGHSSCYKTRCSIARPFLGNKEMTLKEKLKAVEGA